jgi:hypothetical protein
VLPHLTGLLSSDKEAVRSVLVDFTAKLLILGCKKSENAAEVTTTRLSSSELQSVRPFDNERMMVVEFLRRFKDVKPEIRVQMLEAAVKLVDVINSQHLHQVIIKVYKVSYVIR